MTVFAAPRAPTVVGAYLNSHVRAFTRGELTRLFSERALRTAVANSEAARVLPGIYAATAYHDENDNGKFDKNRAGLPVEGFGVSNNPATFLAPPSHDQAAFAVSHGRTRVNIEIKY